MIQNNEKNNQNKTNKENENSQKTSKTGNNSKTTQTRGEQIKSKKVKKGSSIGGKYLLIGGGIFILFIIFITFIFFFYLTENPDVGEGFGIESNTIKSITGLFAGLLFGGLFILFLVLGLTYTYKAFSGKSTFKNIMGIFIILILGITNITFGWIVFIRISNIKGNYNQNTKDVLIGQIKFAEEGRKSKIKNIPLYNNDYPLIAPIGISFNLNKNVFENNYLNKLKRKYDNFKIQKFILDCGNGKTINYDNFEFEQRKYCLYLKKGEYNINFKLAYITKNGKQEEVLPGETILISSQIDFKTNYKLNDKKNEIIGGEKNENFQIDLRSIPTDLGLKKNNIEVAFEETNFKTLKGIAKHSYKNDGLYQVKIKIPGKNNIYPIYTFPLRITPSTKPNCTVQKNKNNGKYIFQVSGESPYGAINKYEYSIKNITENKNEKSGRGSRFATNLKNGSNYKIIWNLIDEKGNKGSCESNIIKLSDKKSYNYKIQILDENGKDIEYNKNNVIVKKIPSNYKIKIGEINPKGNLTVGFDLDNDGQIDEKTKEKNIKIKYDEIKHINTIVKDNYGNSTIKNITFEVNQKSIIADLNSIKNKGEAPLKIIFDASTSEVTSENDEITYFQWDFGDGNVNNNTRQGNISHTYKKVGKYTAKVTVETKKGNKDTAKKDIFVYRPTQNASLIFPENLGGQIKKGKNLKIKIQTDGGIKNIKRDFGDGENFSCEGNQCITTNHNYKKEGLFKIKAKIEYINGSPSKTATSTINVIK